MDLNSLIKSEFKNKKSDCFFKQLNYLLVILKDKQINACVLGFRICILITNLKIQNAIVFLNK